MRPPKSEKWTHSSELELILNQNDVIEYTKANKKGYPLITRLSEVGKKCTVIIGVKKLKGKRKVHIVPDDEVRTCSFNYRGNLQSVGIPNAEKELTIIIHQ